jgi:hypothetical protein
MAMSIFDDKLREPGAEELAEALGRTSGLCNELTAMIDERFDPVAREWVFSGKNYGWSLRLKQKKRAILYMTPCAGHFRVAFAFGEKAVQAALQSGLPADVQDLVNNAPKYPEGRGVRMEVKSRQDIRIAVKLAEIKMAH